jgi:hypothetical protein
MSCFYEQRDFCVWLESGEGQAVVGVERARLAVHRNTFVGTLVEALAESFPVTRALAGSDFFDAMARDCVLSSPPRSPVLTDYFIHFPDFVAGFAPAQAVPVIAQMARLEALRLRAFHAADADAVGRQEFHRLACDAGLLARTAARLHPAAHWLEGTHALLDLWQAHAGAEDIGSVNLAALDIERPQDVLVHRPRFELQMRALPTGARVLLDTMAGGASLAEAFAQAIAHCPQAEPAALFSLLLQEGLVTELIELDEPTP